MTRRHWSRSARARIFEAADGICDGYEDPQHDDDEIQEDCGLLPDGQCLLAGTEHCDWDCGRLRPWLPMPKIKGGE